MTDSTSTQINRLYSELQERATSLSHQSDAEVFLTALDKPVREGDMDTLRIYRDYAFDIQTLGIIQRTIMNLRDYGNVEDAFPYFNNQTVNVVNNVTSAMLDVPRMSTIGIYGNIEKICTLAVMNHKDTDLIIRIIRERRTCDYETILDVYEAMSDGDNKTLSQGVL